MCFTQIVSNEEFYSLSGFNEVLIETWLIFNIRSCKFQSLCWIWNNFIMMIKNPNYMNFVRIINCADISFLLQKLLILMTKTNFSFFSCYRNRSIMCGSSKPLLACSRKFWNKNWNLEFVFFPKFKFTGNFISASR